MIYSLPPDAEAPSAAAFTDLREYIEHKIGMTLEEIKASIMERDRMDRNKAEGALKKAPDAVYIDTSDLTISQVCAIIEQNINA